MDRPPVLGTRKKKLDLTGVEFLSTVSEETRKALSGLIDSMHAEGKKLDGIVIDGKVIEIAYEQATEATQPE